MMLETIRHWRFEDGVGPYSAQRGWYCWVYPENDHEFESWMESNCPTADVTHRFNSGDPMYSVYISDDTEATLFYLKWK